MIQFSSINEITEAIIGAAIEVHRSLGPGLLENAYETCLCREMKQRFTKNSELRRSHPGEDKSVIVQSKEGI